MQEGAPCSAVCNVVQFLGSFGNFFLSSCSAPSPWGSSWYYYPDQFVRLQRSASIVREWIVAHAWSARSESILRFMLEDRQLLLIAFVLTIRFLLGLIVLLSIVMLQRLKALFVGGVVPAASTAAPKDR